MATARGKHVVTDIGQEGNLVDVHQCQGVISLKVHLLDNTAAQCRGIIGCKQPNRLGAQRNGNRLSARGVRASRYLPRWRYVPLAVLDGGW